MQSAVACVVPSAYKGYGDASVILRRATDADGEPGILGKTWFTFAGVPIITAIFPAVGPISGGQEVTLYGSNLGPAKIFLQARIGGTAAMITAIPTYSTATIKTPQGRGGNKKVELLIDGQVTEYSYFSYVAAFIVGLPLYDRQYNSPGTGSISLTVAGLNFGTTDPTPRQRIDGSACEATEWMADTTLRCKDAAGVGATKYLSVTIDLQIAWTLTELVSYDIPSLSVPRRMNRAGTGSQSVTIAGAHFGHASYSGGMRYGHTACETTRWIADTATTCQISSGVRGTRKISVTMGIRVGTTTEAKSFDTGYLSVTRKTNRAATGSASITIHGGNMGLTTYTKGIQEGHTGCEATEWESETSM
eukprot:3255266-Rhodomonas_salina.1